MRSNPQLGISKLEVIVFLLILSIVGLIAAQNYEEYSLESKIIRVKTDLRAYTIANQSYFMDHNAYSGYPITVNFSEQFFFPRLIGVQLTTPVAYLKELSFDPFVDNSFTGVNLHYRIYSNFDAFIITSWGPDKRLRSQRSNFPISGNIVIYDPTNGLESVGDIYHLGGNYMQGNWTIHDIDHKEWDFPVHN